jgi:hypothetical protein
MDFNENGHFSAENSKTGDQNIDPRFKADVKFR